MNMKYNGKITKHSLDDSALEIQNFRWLLILLFVNRLIYLYICGVILCIVYAYSAVMIHVCFFARLGPLKIGYG